MLYRVTALLGMPVAAVLEDCRSSVQRLCTRAELQTMGLEEVS